MSGRGRQDTPMVPHCQMERDLLLELSQTISTTLDTAVLVQVISDGTARLLGVETTALYLLEDGELVLSATTPPLDPGMPAALRRAKREDHPHIAQALARRGE